MAVATDFGRNTQTRSAYPEGNIARRPLMLGMSAEDSQRYARYNLFWNYYNGRHWGHDKQTRDDGDENITLNFCRLFVNKGASFLMGKSWSLKDREEDYSAEQQEFLNKIWHISNKEVFNYEMAQMGGIFGDGGITVLPDNNGGIAINLVPPMFTTIYRHPANKDIIMGVRIRYPLMGSEAWGEQSSAIRRQILTIDLDALNITQYIDDVKISSQAHNLGEVPYVQFRNRIESGSVYGTSDLAAIIPLNRLINEKITDMSDIINYYAAPITLAYGVKIKQLQRGARKFWAGLPSPKDSKIENLVLGDDLAAANNHLNSLVQFLYILAEMPEVAFGKEMDISNTSGVSMQLMFKPLLDVNAMKQISYGKAISQVNRLITKYGMAYGYLQNRKFKDWFDLEEYFQIDVDWPSPLPIDEMINLNMIMNRLKSGTITVQDALSKLGVLNVKNYIQQLLDDRSEGLNIMLPQVPNEMTNLGGVQRGGSTVKQVGASIGDVQLPNLLDQNVL